jgi:hypothetical protein
MEVRLSAQSHPNLAGWFKQMRTLLICAADPQRARDYVAHMKDRGLEKKRIFWRGDRIERMLARGFTRGFSRKSTKGGFCGQDLRYPRRLIEIPPKLIGSRSWGPMRRN